MEIRLTGRAYRRAPQRTGQSRPRDRDPKIVSPDSPDARLPIAAVFCMFNRYVDGLATTADCEILHKASPRKRDERAATAIRNSGQTLSAAGNPRSAADG